MLQRLLAVIQKKEEGFTLVELLIVVAIIAILAAIAIPQFSAYRKRGYAATLNSDAKNAYTASQAILAENADATVTCDATSIAVGGTLYKAGYKPSAGVTCSGDMFADTGSFTITPTAANWGVTPANINYLGVLSKSQAS